jgi:predicted phosphodiesterase
VKYGILSDIHGNVWALEAVLADAKHRGVEQFVNLGDILYGPLQPRQTYELLQTLDVVTIQGNEDRIIYEANPSTEASVISPTRSPTLAFVIDQLGAEPIDWLRALPKTTWVSDQIFACHGTPTSDTVYLLEEVASGSPLVRSESAISQLAQVTASVIPVMLCGHSHIPRLVQLETGAIILNPGSVGVPAYDDDLPNYHQMQTHSPLASYAILEHRDRGWFVDLLKVPYDYQQAVAQAKRQGRADWASWIATGRVHSSALPPSPQ